MDDKLTEDRRSKLAPLTALGVDPFGTRLDGVLSTAYVREKIERTGTQPGQTVAGVPNRLAGRVVRLRGHGNLIFFDLRDSSGDLQVGVSKKAVSPQDWAALKLTDLGDLLAVEGLPGRTRAGEPTLWAHRLWVMCKALRQPPEKWHGLADVEARYRQRYVDLFSNPASMRVFRDRLTILGSIRQTLADAGFVEVETPTLQPIYGGAAARPFTTHHHTLDIDLYLRISPELYLKRLLVGGMERVFEISRNFRNEGISTRHNPEFTMLECYQAYGDYHDMMELLESMVISAIDRLGGGYRRPFGEMTIDFTPPWSRVRYADLFTEHVGCDMLDADAVRAAAGRHGIATEQKHPQVVVNELFEACAADTLIDPTFVLDYPAEICPLTRRCPDNPALALRFEAFASGGMELGNAYTELNDPDVQRRTLSAQLSGEGDETMRVMDEDFLTALEYGMPPAGGMGVGIDRLVMVLTNRTSIRDVILFPLQRPKG